METDEITKLLRLKRYEQPPEGYHTAFLYEFRRRQRVALMRQPWYALVLERLMNFFPSMEVPRLAYVAAIALALLAISAVIMFSPRESGTAIVIAKADINRTPDFSLVPKNSISIGNAIPVSTNVSPHYILESKPVQNERPFSF